MYKKIREFMEEMNATNSTLDKKEVLKKYPELQGLLNEVYDPFKKYNITSKNILKNPSLIKETDESLSSILIKLSTRELSGHEAIAVINGYISKHQEDKDIILKIIDKDLECRIGDKAINEVYPELIPTFDVALANSYYDVSTKVNIFDGNWFASHKLDGIRAVAIFDEHNNPTFYSRVGNEIETLSVLKEEFKNIDLSNMVLDGEICLVDENGKEDFQGIMKVLKKKDYDIPNPKYMVFDILTIEDFLKKESKVNFDLRNEVLNQSFKNYTGNKIEVLKQTKIEDENHFNNLLEEAREKDWEGLILRKNTIYKGKRSNDLLKVKDFFDAEYVVDSIETGPFRIIENGIETTIETLSSVLITHKGNIVNVGSGFSLNQRKAIFENPSLIIGKTITVKYFEETTNEKGGISLRFPTIKTIYNGTRNV